MATATRHVRVQPESRVVCPSESRVAKPAPDVRVIAVLGDGGYVDPGYVVIEFFIDAGGPSSTFILIDAGGPSSTYPLMDANYA